MSVDLDIDVLDRYCETFVGYGSLKGHIWFIGMEEGGGACPQMVAKRLAIWRNMGGRHTMDAKQFHDELGGGSHPLFTPGAPLQRTWNKLIEAYFAAHARPSHRESRRQFQVERLGRAKADHCLLELMPLPSPNVGKWALAGGKGKAEWLSSRSAYSKRWRRDREMMIARLIRKYRPRTVLMYGDSHLASWHAIAGTTLRHDRASGMRRGEHGGVHFLALPHPRRSTLAQWRVAGKAVRLALRRIR